MGGASMTLPEGDKGVSVSSLIEALAHRRSRRFGMGGELTSGYTKYKSRRDPAPLTKRELALLCWAGAGPNGLVLSDIDSRSGCSTQVQHPGRTFPSPCNHHKTTLMFTNDDGVFVYDPREATKPVQIENESDLELLVNEFDQDIIQLQDKRADIPQTGLVKLNIPSSNRPGQTLFMPIVNPTYEIINSLFTLSQYEKYKIIDDETNKPAGIEKWVDKLGLVVDVPLSFFMNLTGIAISLEAGFITQNLLLMAEAMGLGAFPHSGYVPLVAMGGTPLTRGLGFRFVTDKKGMPNPVGIDAVKPLKGFCPPYYETMRDAVQAVYESKYEEGAIFSDSGGPSPFRDQKAFVRGVEEIHEDVLECAKDLCSYVYDKYGRFPVGFDTMMMPIWIGVHHVDIDFYDRFYREGVISPNVRSHMSCWHEKI